MLSIYLIVKLTLKIFTPLTTKTTEVSINDFQEKIESSCFVPKFENYKQKKQFNNNLECPPKDDLVIIIEGIVHKINSENCTYNCINWNTDFDYHLSDTKILENMIQVPCNYFIVTCSNVQQVVLTATINTNQINQSHFTLRNKTKPDDVILIGIESLSYQAFEFYLQNTFSIFHQDLNGVSFKKFNSRGNNKVINLLALLAGMKEMDIFDENKDITSRKPVDNLNWIWKHYKKNGYVTLLAEEMTENGAFQYETNGFEKQPTDFYLRTPFMFIERNRFYKDFCLGNRPLHLEYLKFFDDFQISYKNIPKFSILLFNFLSNSDNKYVSFMDNDLSEFLLKIRKTNPETLIILFSVYGKHLKENSLDYQFGEKLTFLGLSLPKNKENLLSILIENSVVLTNVLDLHATLEDFIGIYKPSFRNLHMSLFRRLPNDRNCEDIELYHWCSCLKWKIINEPNLNSELIKISDAIVNRISSFTKFNRNLCASLNLNKIILAYRLGSGLLEKDFNQNRKLNKFRRQRKIIHWFRLIFQTFPGDSVFEITIKVVEISFRDILKFVIEEFRPEDINRINNYDSWIKCLHQRNNRIYGIKDVRKFCICKM